MWAGALRAKPCGGRNVQQEMGGGHNEGCWLLFWQVPSTGLKEQVPHAI